MPLSQRNENEEVLLKDNKSIRISIEMTTKCNRDRNQKEVQRKTPIRANFKDETKFRSRRNDKNLINSFKPLSESEETDGSNSFWSEDTKRIGNRKVYKNESHQGNRNYRKDKKKAVKKQSKKEK